jgi:hypothetical protein
VSERTTENSSERIVELSVIRRERHLASSPYGPVKAGLTTYQDQEINKENLQARLMELHSYLESTVANLNSKSYTVSDTLIIAIQGARVALSASTNNTGGTE